MSVRCTVLSSMFIQKVRRCSFVHILGKLYLCIEACNNIDEMIETKEKIEDEIMEDEMDENQAVDDNKPPSSPSHATTR